MKYDFLFIININSHSAKIILIRKYRNECMNANYNNDFEIID